MKVAIESLFHLDQQRIASIRLLLSVQALFSVPTRLDIWNQLLSPQCGKPAKHKEPASSMPFSSFFFHAINQVLHRCQPILLRQDSQLGSSQQQTHQLLHNLLHLPGLETPIHHKQPRRWHPWTSSNLPCQLVDVDMSPNTSGEPFHASFQFS